MNELSLKGQKGGRRVLGLIPARGGSKRIPHKNIIMFEGRPMLAYPLQAARESGIVDRLHVSTDDEEIARVALAHGADVNPRRPAHLADDHTPVLEVARWVLQQFAEAGEHYDDVLILYPCSPLLQVSDIQEAYRTYLKHEGKYNLLTVARVPVYPEWLYRRQEDGRLVPLVPGGAFIRSQDLEPAYYETGTFTIFSSEWLLNAPTLQDDTNYISHVLPPERAVDIDTPEDLRFAVSLYRSLNGDSGKRNED